MNVNFAEKLLRDTWPLVTRDCYSKFILLWVLFEVWIKEKSKNSKTRDALNWFKNKDNNLMNEWKHFYDTAKVTAARNTFITIGRKHGLCLKNKDRPEEVIESIYQVRNNLIHGNWKLLDYPSQKSNDYENLIYSSALILRYWLESGWHDKILYD